MNKDLLDQIPAEEQPVASKLQSLVDDMQPTQTFQWDLENQLMNKATAQPTQRWFTKIMIPVGWAIAAIGGVLLLNWTIRSLVPQPPPAAGPTATQEISFADNIRTGNICMGPLAIGHGFAVFLTNPEKTGFVALDAGNTIGELRSFTWSADGKQLAMVGNSLGSGNMYLSDPSGSQPQPILSNGELGYLMDAAWSRDGKQFAMWSNHNNRILYLLNADGTGLIEKRLGNVQILGTPQFWPDGRSVAFYGATPSAYGLFEIVLTESEASLIHPSVESATGYAFSPDGSRLAYVEYDRENGEARLISENLTTRELATLGTLPIPTGSGAAVPETANPSWSADGNFLAFDFGRNAADRAIYLAYADGSGLIKVVEEAYAPSVSADGKCLAYISDNQVFLLDLANVSTNSTTATSILLADLPTGRGTPNSKQDKLQWRPEAIP